MLRLFWDEENGGFFFYGSDAEQLFTRPKEIYDGAMPSGNSAAALNLLRLSKHTYDARLSQKKPMNRSKLLPVRSTLMLRDMLFSLWRLITRLDQARRL